MRFQRSFDVLCAICLLPVFAQGADDARKPFNPSAVTAFLHVNVIPMDRERVLQDETVVVEGHQITQIGPSKTIKVPANARRVQALGEYLIPGLTDAQRAFAIAD